MYGVANDDSVRAMRLLNQTYKPAIMVIVEPKVCGGQADVQVRKLGLFGHH